MPVSKSRRKGKKKKTHGGPKSGTGPREITLDIDALGGFPGYEKMSEVLKEFAEPYELFASSEEDYKALYGVAALAWNMALSSRKEREEAIQDMVRQGLPPIPEDARVIINELIHRKQMYFAECKRIILNYQVTMIPEGTYLRVISTPV